MCKLYKIKKGHYQSSFIMREWLFARWQWDWCWINFKFDSVMNGMQLDYIPIMYELRYVAYKYITHKYLSLITRYDLL